MNCVHPSRNVSQESLSTVDYWFGTTQGAWLAGGITILYCIYTALFRFGLPLLPFSELVWNALVFATPAGFILALDKRKNPGMYSDSSPKIQSTSEKHAVKSEAMRRVLGLDNGILKAFPGAGAARRASWLGGITSRSDAPPGLGNWDNSCYQNSVLQGLSALRSLTTFLDNINTFSTQDSTTTAGSLRETMMNLNDSSNNGRRIWTPAKLKSMSSWQQQDAQEYFSRIMDDLEKETSKSMKLTSTNNGLRDVRGLDTTSEADAHPQTQILEKQTQAEGSIQEEHQTEASRNPLDGCLAQRVACLRCGFSEGLSMISFNCLTVPLGKEQSYQVQDCLDEYTNLEEISGVECAKCTLLQQKIQLEGLTQQSDDVAESAKSVVSLPSELRTMFMDRLQAVQQALDDDDFSDNTLNKKCQVPKKARVSSTKTRQAVVARAPQSLVIHVNRSLFDEYTGAQRKNYAEVKYSKVLDLGPWCLGRPLLEDEAREGWPMDPAKSLIASSKPDGTAKMLYVLRAAVCHYGRHENGHYICYREHPERQSEKPDSETSPKWWRLSDDDVSASTEEEVLSQGGVFMLFYERLEQAIPSLDSIPPVLQAVVERAGQSTIEEPQQGGIDNMQILRGDVVKQIDRVGEAESTAVAISSSTKTEDESGIEMQPLLLQTKNLPTPALMRTARNGGKTNKRESGGFSAFRAMAAT